MPKSTRLRPFTAAVAFASGVAASGGAGPLSIAPLPFAFLALILLAWPRRANLVVVVAFAALGVARAAADRASAVAALDRVPSGPQWFEGEVDGFVERGRESVRFSLESDGVRYLVIAMGADSARLEAPLPGDRVRVWAEARRGPTHRGPGVGSDANRLRAGGHAARLVAAIERVEVTRGRGGVWRAANRLQRSLSEAIEVRGGDASGNALVRALATGDRSGVSEDLADPLRRAGIAHLLAVSGLHLAVVGLLSFALIRRLWSAVPALSSRVEATVVASVVALGVAATYAAVTGARPSALRALLVTAIVLAAVAVFRRPRGSDALGAAALILLCWRPGLIHDASFQMSFAATLVLVLAHRPRLPAVGLGRLWRVVVSLAAMSAWAMAATAPTASHLFGELAPAGLLVNVVALPWVELAVLPLSMVGTLLSLVSATAGGAVLDAAIATAGWLAVLAVHVAEHGPTWSVAPMSTAEVTGVALAIGALLAATRAVTRWLRIALALAAAVAALATVASLTVRRVPRGLVVTFLDVGQGDAAVLEFPSGRVWLVDAEGRPSRGAQNLRRAASPGRVAVLGYLRAKRISTIDVAVVSHAHPDHYLGLWALGSEVAIRELWIADADPDQARPLGLSALTVWLRVLGTEVRAPPRHWRDGDAAVDVLGPGDGGGAIAVDPVSSTNDNSIVLRVSYAGRRVLFAGDLEDEGEALTVAATPNALDVDVLKVNHHGSRTSSTPAWVARTTPSLAIVSCGRRNRYGFPAPEVVARWRRVGARVLRTDERGAIAIAISPAGRISTRTSVGPLPRRGAWR